jgi:hypothetical protein
VISKAAVPALLIAAFSLSACAAYDPAVRMGKHGAVGVNHRVMALDIQRLMEMGRPIPPPFGYLPGR